MTLGRELLGIHRQLRARLSGIERALEIDVSDAAAFGNSCLVFCRALRRHHVGEDDAAFQVLRQRRPDLGAVLDNLMQDHRFLDPMLERLEKMATEQSADTDRGAIDLEVAGISALLTNHLAYEERVLVSVLDGLEVEGDSREVQALRAPLDGIFEPADS
jgi:hemerythrin-like domain-containing protein